MKLDGGGHPKPNRLVVGSKPRVYKREEAKAAKGRLAQNALKVWLFVSNECGIKQCVADRVLLF